MWLFKYIASWNVVGIDIGMLVHLKRGSVVFY